MKCSVIIPYFSRKSLLINSLRSLSKQQCDTIDFEIVVIDDGSNDLAEHEILNLKLPVDIKYYKYERGSHSCAAFARNRGIKHSSGEIIICLDCDQIVSSSFVQEHCRPFQEAGDAEILQIGTRTFLKESDSYDLYSIEDFVERRDSRHRLFSTYSDNMASLRGGWHLVFSNNISFLRSTVEKHGSFDEKFKGWGLEDTEFGYRLVKNGVRIVYNPNVEVFHQYHTTQQSTENRLTQWLTNLKYFTDKHHDLPVMMQHVFADHFDEIKKNKLLKRDIKYTWDYCFSRFENGLRAIFNDTQADTKRCFVFDDPTIEQIKLLIGHSEAESLVILCSKNNVKLWMWAQCHDFEFAQRLRLIIKNSNTSYLVHGAGI